MRAIVLICVAIAAVHAASFTRAVDVNTGSVPLYGKLELTLPLQASYSNPYDPSQIQVDAFFQHQEGNMTTPCFHAARGGKNQWLCRFAPHKVGSWSFHVTAKDSQGTAQSPKGNFTAVAGSNRGFIRRTNKDNLHFEYEDGTTYWPIGENMGWGNSGNYLDSYKKWLPKLKAVGGNYIRVWQNSGGWRLEYKVGDYSGGQNNADGIDKLVDLAESLGFGILWCFNEHPDFSSKVNPNWNGSPYNKKQGGPLGSAEEVWTNDRAKTLFQYRYRYNIARWGYSTSIFSWELWNEMDWIDNWGSHSGDATNWVRTMYNYIKNTDPHKHLISTSFAMMSGRDGIDQITDWTQYHSYSDGGNRISIPDYAGWLAGSISAMTSKYKKPNMVGEFGTSYQGPWVAPYTDPTGLSIHNEAWGSLVAGAGGSGFTWWWDNYVEPRNLYWRFQGISGFVNGEQLGGMSPIQTLDVSNSDKLRASSLSGNGKHLVWVQSKAHTWWNVKNGGGQSYVNGASVSVSCQNDDKYTVQIWHTTKGQMTSNSSATCSGGKIKISLPNFNDQDADWAAKVFTGNAPRPTPQPTRPTPTGNPTSDSGVDPVPTTSPAPSPTGGLGEWEFCDDSLQCANGCCSKEFSGDGKYKCTPNGMKCKKNATKGEWEFCSSSSECLNHCCSKEYSGDKKYKCTPGGTKCK